MKKRLCLSRCCFLLILITSHVYAQELSGKTQKSANLSSDKQKRPPMENAFTEFTWLPGSGIHNSGGDLTMVEMKTGFDRKIKLTPSINLTTGLRYSLLEINAPDSAGLPSSLHSLSLDIAGEYRATDVLTFGVRVSPGFNSDFKSVTPDNIRVPVVLYTHYLVSGRLFLLGGVVYTGLEHSIPVLPAIGVMYYPSQKWSLTLGLPRTGIAFKPNKKTEFFMAGEQSMGEYELHDSSIGAKIISYQDYRVLTGVEMKLSTNIKLDISGGYAFAREFVFHEGDRKDLDLDRSLFGRLHVKLSW